ncbi:MAG: ATP-binding protein [Patescibacteria group bacterium]|nr:ATP-binding protein [Patescibacteria group bacterium]
MERFGYELPRIIAFIGTSSVGKTTLYEWCRKKIADSGCAVIDEAATRYFSTHTIPEKLRFTEGVQREIQSIAIGLELALMTVAQRRGLEFAFLDRCALCAPVYVRSTGDFEGSERLYEFMKPLLQIYTRLYLLDPEGVEFRQNQIRTEDRATRDRIHKTYLEFLKEKKLKYKLLSGTEQQRKEAVREYVLYLADGGVGDNVSGSPEVALRNKYAKREGEIFKMMNRVFRLIRSRENIVIPGSIQDLFINLHLSSSEFSGCCEVLASIYNTVEEEQALQIVFKKFMGEIPLQKYSLTEAKSKFTERFKWQTNDGLTTLDLPTKIDGLNLRLSYTDSGEVPRLSFILEEFV